MTSPHKLRLGDGSVIKLDPADMRSWYERGLINDETMVQPPGSRGWTRLPEVVDVRGWRGGARSRASARPAAPAARPAAARAPSPWLRRLALGAATVVLLATAAVAAFWWWGARKPGAGDTAASSEDEVLRRRQMAVQTAAMELPHLGPETIERVMAASAAGVLDPPEVFRRSYEAAGRGLTALSPAESAELGRLHASLTGALSPTERTRLSSYLERVRGRRPTSPSEDMEMSRLVRKAAQALPPAARTRLQLLFAKTVAAALAT